MFECNFSDQNRNGFSTLIAATCFDVPLIVKAGTKSTKMANYFSIQHIRVLHFSGLVKVMRVVLPTQEIQFERACSTETVVMQAESKPWGLGRKDSAVNHALCHLQDELHPTGNRKRKTRTTIINLL
jgi:hypothetical protein